MRVATLRCRSHIQIAAATVATVFSECSKEHQSDRAHAKVATAIRADGKVATAVKKDLKKHQSDRADTEASIQRRLEETSVGTC